MRWFSGSIGEAVASSKAKGAVFVVFVEGPDDVSQTTAAAIESPEVLSKLESDNFVAIKLGSGSEEYKQFTEIYRIVPIPSIFFIGGNGRPIEIVAGASDAAAVLTRINVVLTKSSADKTASATSGASSATSGASSATSGASTATSGASTAALQAVNVAPADTVSATDPSTAPIETAEEKVAKAKALLERTRLAKLAEEKAKEREKEEERRRVGRDMQELRRWQQDQEMKQMKEEREREKREEREARERVKKQIEQDKAERVKRNQAASGGPAEPSVIREQPKATSNSDTARLQLRMPNGSAVTTQLPATAPLGQLRAFVSQQLNQSTDFMMSTSFPRRELLVSEDQQTLAELSLVPTAVILVLPTSSGARLTLGGSSPAGVIAPVTNLFWTLIGPVLSLFTYVRTLVFGGGANAGTAANSGAANDAAKRSRLMQQQQPQQPQQQQSGGEGARRRQGGETTVRRQGNVHRLAQPQDSSDEENNTWNGNSTQQM